jgi:DNA-binding NarL/FixJ family response regulator
MINTTPVPRLLIADDDPLVREMLSMQLVMSFDVVGNATDADEAIEQTEALKPDVVILDVQMPGGGGLRATREIQAHNPDVTIVALSCDENDAMVREILIAGAMTYLRKGIRGEELDTALRAALAAHAA